MEKESRSSVEKHAGHRWDLYSRAITPFDLQLHEVEVLANQRDALLCMLTSVEALDSMSVLILVQFLVIGSIGQAEVQEAKKVMRAQVNYSIGISFRKRSGESMLFNLLSRVS